MTSSPRVRIVVAALVLACAIPIETILLQALAVQDREDAIAAWVSALSNDDLQAVAAQIEWYPFAYRREIMRALTPPARSDAWRGYIKRFIDRHPELDESARQLLDEAAAVATPEIFSAAGADSRARAVAIGDQLSAVIGTEAARDVLYRLGPRDGTFASLEPLRLQLANYVRNAMVALADGAGDCDCSNSFGCGDNKSCQTSGGCDPVEEWPACGWLWIETCDGACRLIDAN